MSWKFEVKFRKRVVKNFQLKSDRFKLEKSHLLYEKYEPPFIFDAKKRFENELVTNVKEKMNCIADNEIKPSRKYL